MMHEVKSWVGLFEPLMKGEKTHDFRTMDRPYEVGDLMRLREYDPITQTYTGRECKKIITYITSARHGHCAESPTKLHPATGILSIKDYP